MVPTPKTLAWTALIGLPVALAGAMQPEAWLPGLALVLGLLLVIVWDAFRGQKGLESIEIELPETIRLTKGKPAEIQLRFKNPVSSSILLRAGIAWPKDIDAQDHTDVLTLPADSAWREHVWKILPVSRGRSIIHTIFLESPSSLGFWVFRRAQPIQCEIRVYPSLLKDRRNLAGLFLNKSSIGIHARRMVGKGREFEKLRDYIPGDGPEDIHWKATAKRSHPMSKVYQVERTQEIYLVMDTSRLSRRLETPTPGQEPEPHLERYLTAALVLGLAAQQQGDLFGLITFSNQVDQFLRARNGKAHYHACRDSLYQLQPKAVTPDFQEVASFIRLRLRRRALILFLTALDDPVLAENFTASMNLICRQHLVLVNMIQPPEAKPLFDRPNVSDLDDIYHRLGGHIYWSKLKELEKQLHRIGIQFTLTQNERLSLQMVNQYLETKQRQLL